MELFFLCLLRRRSVLNAFLNLLLLFLQNDPKRTKLKPYRKEGRRECLGFLLSKKYLGTNVRKG